MLAFGSLVPQAGPGTEPERPDSDLTGHKKAEFEGKIYLATLFSRCFYASSSDRSLRRPGIGLGPGGNADAGVDHD